jgi:hypothetical protein
MHMDLSRFRVPKEKMKSRTIEAGRAPRSGRFPASSQVSSKLYAEDQFVEQQIGRIVFHLQSLQPERKIGFS